MAFSNETRRVLSLIAHYEMAAKLDKDVFTPMGATGFREFWLSRCSEKERQQLADFEKMLRQAMKDLSEEFKKNGPL
jgi:hypothetical protein